MVLRRIEHSQGGTAITGCAAITTMKGSHSCRAGGFLVPLLLYTTVLLLMILFIVVSSLLDDQEVKHGTENVHLTWLSTHVMRPLGRVSNRPFGVSASARRRLLDDAEASTSIWHLTATACTTPSVLAAIMAGACACAMLTGRHVPWADIASRLVRLLYRDGFVSIRAGKSLRGVLLLRRRLRRTWSLTAALLLGPALYLVIASRGWWVDSPARSVCLLLACFGLPTLLALADAVRSLRRFAGGTRAQRGPALCLRCGYSVGTGQQACPECGQRRVNVAAPRPRSPFARALYLAGVAAGISLLSIVIYVYSNPGYSDLRIDSLVASDWDRYWAKSYEAALHAPLAGGSQSVLRIPPDETFQVTTANGCSLFVTRAVFVAPNGTATVGPWLNIGGVVIGVRYATPNGAVIIKVVDATTMPGEAERVSVTTEDGAVITWTLLPGATEQWIVSEPVLAVARRVDLQFPDAKELRTRVCQSVASLGGELLDTATGSPQRRQLDPK